MFSRRANNAIAPQSTQPVTLPVPDGEQTDTDASRRDAVDRRLQPLGTAAQFGVPFGPGRGIEAAAAAITAVMPDVGELRSYGESFAQRYISVMQEKRISFDDYDHALGIDEASAARHGLRNREGASQLAAVTPSKRVLVEFWEPDKSTFARWLREKAFVIECLAYHNVAWQRLDAMDRIWPRR